jgi:hypothetical protein
VLDAVRKDDDSGKEPADQDGQRQSAMPGGDNRPLSSRTAGAMARTLLLAATDDQHDLVFREKAVLSLTAPTGPP